jgi:hypothetical protein
MRLRKVHSEELRKCTFATHFLDDPVKDGEMTWAHSKHEAGEKCEEHAGLNLYETDHFEDLSVNVTVLKWVLNWT